MVTWCGCNITIMNFVYFGHILHPAATNLHCGFVENFMQSMRFWKMSIDQSKKKFLQHLKILFVKWWFKPNNISRSIFLVFVVDFCYFEPIFLQSTFLFTFCSVEYLLIRRVFWQFLLDGIQNLVYDVWWVVW